MATAQQVREETKSVSWSSIFPQEQVTETQSALFVKKLLAVAVSSITYLRAIFPEHAFGDRRLEDLNLKILKDDSACPGSCQVIQWIKGCFDALDNKYLRMIVIGIYVDAEDPDTIIESYTFKFTYNKEGITIFRNDNKIASAYTEAETKKATIRLLRTIIILTQTLTSLPDDVMMTMKLLYYDEATPSSYQPPGFKETPVSTFQFEEEPMNIKVGDVSTPFHTVKLRIKTEFHQFDLKDEQADDEDSTSINVDDMEEVNMQDVQSPDKASPAPDKNEVGGTPVILRNKKRKQPSSSSSEQTVPGSNPSMECDSAPQEDAHEPGMDETAGGITKEISKTSTPVSDQDEKQAKDTDPDVNCSCTYNEDDGLMIMCGMCNTWQHAICYGILEENEAPELHICALCSKKDGVAKCTDPSLKNLNPVVLQSTCLWRRALSACTEMSRILPTMLSRRLGIEITVAQGLMNRLEKEGFIRPALKGKRLGKIINKAKLTIEDLKTYMDCETQERQKTFEKISSVDNKNATSIDSITEKASNMDLSGRLRGRKSKDMAQVSKQGKRKGKRVISNADEYHEFEISDSQEPTHDDEAPARKRKASIANKAILV